MQLPFYLNRGGAKRISAERAPAAWSMTEAGPAPRKPNVREGWVADVAT